MGVDSLWPLLAKAGRPTNPARLAGRRVAVDASIWLAPHLLSQNTPRTAHLNSLFRRLAKLLFFRVRPVFVFDGARPALKEAELRRRSMARKGRDEKEQASRIGRAAHRLLQARLAAIPGPHPTLPAPPASSRRSFGAGRDADDEPDWKDATPVLRKDKHSTKAGIGKHSKKGHSDADVIDLIVVEDDKGEKEDEKIDVSELREKGMAGTQKRQRAGVGDDDDEIHALDSDKERDESDQVWEDASVDVLGGGKADDENESMTTSMTRDERRESAQERWAALASSTPSGVSALQLSALLHRAKPLTGPFRPASSSTSGTDGMNTVSLSGRLAAQPDTTFHYTRTDLTKPQDENELLLLSDDGDGNDQVTDTKCTDIKGGKGDGDLEWEPVMPQGADESPRALDGVIFSLDREPFVGDGRDDAESDWEAEAEAWEAWERAGRQEEAHTRDISSTSSANEKCVAMHSHSDAQPPPGDAQEEAEIQIALALSLVPSAPAPELGTVTTTTLPVADVGSVWGEFRRDCHELLRMFGVPWLSAPSEAEAQCAWLNEQGLVDAVISDDSDTLLFGDRIVLVRHLFRRNVAPLAYASADISTTLGLTRARLIDLALLLGSDYTPGLPNVGPVRALEVLAAFPTLAEFAHWVRTPTEASNANTKITPALEALRQHLRLPGTFPDARVREAYVHAHVDESATPFVWAQPDLAALRLFAIRKLHWPTPLIDRILGPLEQTEKEPEAHQRTLDSFVIPLAKPVPPKSVRLDSAVQRLVSPSGTPTASITPVTPSAKKKKPTPKKLPSTK